MDNRARAAMIRKVERKIKAKYRKMCGWCFLIALVIGLVLGFLMLASPLVVLISLNYIVGIYLILLGIDTIVLAFSNMGRRW